MAQITWNQMQAPDFKAANALLLSGQEQFNTAIQQAGKVVTDYQAANTKNNTDAIMNALQSAKSPEEYQAALANAQAIAGTKSGDFDQEKFNAAQISQPGLLQERQQQAYGYSDDPILNQVQQLIATGDFEGASKLVPSLKSNLGTSNAVKAIQDAVGNASTVKHARAQEDLASNQAAATIAQQGETNRLAQAKFDWEKQQAGASGRTLSDGTTVTNQMGGSGNTGTPKGLSYFDIKAGVAPADVNSVIAQQVDKAFQSESSGGTNLGKNPKSSASGGYGFIDGTWLDQLAKTRPDLVNGRTPQQLTGAYAANKNDPTLQPLLALKNDLNLSKQVATNFTTQNATALSNAGIPVNQVNLDGAHFLGSDGYTKMYNAYQKNPNAPASITADARKANTTSFGDNPTNADVMNAIAKRNGYSLDQNASKGQPNPYSFNNKDFLPVFNTYKKALIDINESKLKNEKFLAKDGDPTTYQANLAQWVAKNQGGLTTSVLGLNSGSKQQMALAQQVSGFNELNSKAKLGVMESLAAWNNSAGAFSKYTNQSDDAIKAKAAEVISSAIKSYSANPTERTQALYEKAILDVRNKLQEKGANPEEPTDQEILAATFGVKAAKDYKDPNATSIIKAGNAPVVATSSPASAPPITVTPVAAVQRTSDNTPLGLRAIQGVGNILGSVASATSTPNIAASLLRGGADTTREAANKLKYGSLYPYMKANNDPRLKN